MVSSLLMNILIMLHDLHDLKECTHMNNNNSSYSVRNIPIVIISPVVRTRAMMSTPLVLVALLVGVASSWRPRPPLLRLLRVCPCL